MKNVYIVCLVLVVVASGCIGNGPASGKQRAVHATDFEVLKETEIMGVNGKIEDSMNILGGVDRTVIIWRPAEEEAPYAVFKVEEFRSNAEAQAAFKEMLKLFVQSGISRHFEMIEGQNISVRENVYKTKSYLWYGSKFLLELEFTNSGDDKLFNALTENAIRIYR